MKNRDPDNWADKQETEVNINLREILDNASTRISEQQVNTIDVTPEKPIDIRNDKEILIPSKNDSKIIQDPEEKSSRSTDLKDD